MTATEILNESIELTIKGFLENILEEQPIGEIIEKTGLIDLAIAKAKDENKNIRNLIINDQQTELDENTKANFFQRKALANTHVGNAIIEKIIETVPAEYTSLLSDQFEDLSDTISRSLENPTVLASDLIKDQLNTHLGEFENPLIDIYIDDLEIVPKKEIQELKCSFNFSIKEYAPKIFVKISVNPQLGQNPIIQLGFKIVGEINLYDVMFRKSGELEISLGEFDLNLNIQIEEIEIARTAIPIGESNVLYSFSMNKLKDTISDFRTSGK